jgi:hypothetical protein
MCVGVSETTTSLALVCHTQTFVEIDPRRKKMFGPMCFFYIFELPFFFVNPFLFFVARAREW